MNKIWKLALLALVVPGLAVALEVAGHTYQPTVTVEGQSLKLVGAGVRNKWFFDVYALAAYTKSGDCGAQQLIDQDEPKMLQIDMLRDVGAKKMASTIGESFQKHMPKDASPELAKQRQTFEGYFKEELKKGQTLQFIYLPGKGTLVRQNGKDLGPVLQGQAFQKVLWDIYFGKDSCCGGTKKDILKACTAGPAK